jgi:hypothetical protein
MRCGFLGVVCIYAVVACTDDTGMPIGTADLAFEGAGSATVAWGVARRAATGYAGWSMFFSATGSAETSCNAGSAAAYDDQLDLWTSGATTESPAPLPAGEYNITDPALGCGSDAMCGAMYIADGTVEWAEVELLDSDTTHLRGSLMGSAASGSGAEKTFYGVFDAEVCAQ